MCAWRWLGSAREAERKRKSASTARKRAFIRSVRESRVYARRPLIGHVSRVAPITRFGYIFLSRAVSGSVLYFAFLAFLLPSWAAEWLFQRQFMRTAFHSTLKNAKKVPAPDATVPARGERSQECIIIIRTKCSTLKMVRKKIIIISGDEQRQRRTEKSYFLMELRAEGARKRKKLDKRSAFVSMAVTRERCLNNFKLKPKLISLYLAFHIGFARLCPRRSAGSALSLSLLMSSRAQEDATSQRAAHPGIHV